MAIAAGNAARPSYVELEVLVGEQAARIAELEAVVAELRVRVGQNSRNSSKPPSSDGYAKPPANKKKRSLRRRSGRKPGGQPGSAGHHLERREVPDDEQVHPLTRCEECGRDLSAQPIVKSQSRQVLRGLGGRDRSRVRL